MVKLYRGYILARLSRIGLENEICEKVTEELKAGEGQNWKITYASPVYGPWDLIVEVSFEDLDELDTIVTDFRKIDIIAQNIEATSTLISSKPNYDE